MIFWPLPVVSHILISDPHPAEPSETGQMQCGCCGVQFGELPVAPHDTQDFFSKYLSPDELGRMQLVNRENRDDPTNRPKRGLVVDEFWRRWKEKCEALEEALKTRLPARRQYTGHNWRDVTVEDVRAMLDSLTKTIRRILITPSFEELRTDAIPGIEFIEDQVFHAYTILPEEDEDEALGSEALEGLVARLNLGQPVPTYYPPDPVANRGLDLPFNQLKNLVYRLYSILRSNSRPVRTGTAA